MGTINRSTAQLFIPIAPYIEVRDGNDLAASIANRHYSRIWRGNTNQKRLCGNGKRMILIHPLGLWVFVWNFQKWRHDNQEGVNCVLFRNESDLLSSEIILLAEKAWNNRYGNTRKFTYVHPQKIKSSNPGYCFQCAGWTLSEHLSRRGLRLLFKGDSISQTFPQSNADDLPQNCKNCTVSIPDRVQQLDLF